MSKTNMGLRLVVVVVLSVHAMPGFYQGSSAETSHLRRERASPSPPAGVITAARQAPAKKEFSWKAPACTGVRGNSGLDKMLTWKMKHGEGFSSENLKFKALTSGAMFGHTMVLATGVTGTVIFTLIILFVCYRVWNCGDQIKSLLYNGDKEGLRRCFSNGRRRKHRKKRTAKDSSSSSAVIQMASQSSPVKVQLSPSLLTSEIDSASPTPRAAGHFSFNEKDVRVGYQLAESLQKVEENDGECQELITENV